MNQNHGTAPDGTPITDDMVGVFLGLLDGTHTGPAPVDRRGVVKLTVPLSTLIGLADQPGEVGGFRPVIADIARQVAADQPRAEWRYAVVEPHTGRLLHSGVTRRRPTKATADRVVARDWTCRAPGCRAPASRADLDHTVDHARGGFTSLRNLGALCRHHHMVKHRGRYQLRQFAPGHFHWTTPLGHHYLKPPDPASPPKTTTAPMTPHRTSPDAMNVDVSMPMASKVPTVNAVSTPPAERYQGKVDEPLAGEPEEVHASANRAREGPGGTG